MKHLFLILSLCMIWASSAAAQSQMVQALIQIRPGAKWTLPDPPSCNTLDWQDTIQTKPTCTEINNAIAAIPPVQRIVPTSAVLSRFTDAEYTSLMQKRAAAITAGNVSLVRMFDLAMTNGRVDFNAPAAQTFKDGLVSAGVLTQARADVVFGP